MPRPPGSERDAVDLADNGGSPARAPGHSRRIETVPTREPPPPLNSPAEPPLVVDLDGTLLRSDLLVESGLAFLQESAHRALVPLFWLRGGKARLKHELALETRIDVATLPYDPAVIAFIEGQRESGRRIVLATATHRLLAERVAAHLGLFHEVIATDATRNLSARHKRDALVERFGEGGFDYVGNSHDDVVVWRSARRAYLANPERGVERRVRGLGNVEQVLRSGQPTPYDWGRALRLHQWLKNLLIFAPLAAAHRIADVALVTQGLLAFLLFSLCASSVYLLNDLLDLGDDRRHPTKRNRPFASGQLSVKDGLIAFPALLVAAFAGAFWLLPLKFTLVLAVYYGLTLAYSLWLKRRMALDVIALAALYTLRIVAGAAAVGIGLSFWMLAFAMFMFLSLALVKRYAELYRLNETGAGGKAASRGYEAKDAGMVASLGAASGYMAVLVLALYLNDPKAAALYRQPEVIWLACPLLLLWITRVWMITHRGQMHDDPVVFAIRDPASLVVGALFGLVFWAAT